MGQWDLYLLVFFPIKCRILEVHLLQKTNKQNTFNKQRMQAQLPPYFVLALSAVYSSWAHPEPQILSWSSQGNPKSWSVQILLLFSIGPISPLRYSAFEEPVPTNVCQTNIHHSVSAQIYRLFAFISPRTHPSPTEGTTLSGPSTTNHRFPRFT